MKTPKESTIFPAKKFAQFTGIPPSLRLLNDWSGSKDGTTQVGKGGFKIGGEPCVWCGAGWGPQWKCEAEYFLKERRWMYVGWANFFWTVLPLVDVDFRSQLFLKLMLCWWMSFLLLCTLLCGKPRTCTTDSAAKCAPYDWLMNGRGIDLNSALPWVAVC